MSLYDFYMYLKYIEFSPENLEFYIWYQNYARNYAKKGGAQDDGKSFDSPSGAASGVAITKSGKHTRLDGWIYWEAKQPGEDAWTRIATLRTGTLAIEDLGL